MLWKDIKQEKMPLEIDVIVYTDKGAIFRGRYLLCVWVERIFHSHSSFGPQYKKRIDPNEKPFEVFIPHTYEFSENHEDLLKSITHWMPLQIPT